MDSSKVLMLGALGVGGYLAWRWYSGPGGYADQQACAAGGEAAGPGAVPERRSWAGHRDARSSRRVRQALDGSCGGRSSARRIVVIHEIGIELPHTLRADVVAEFRF